MSAHEEVTVALVVDDSRVARRKLKKIMAGFGFQVHEAADGQEALNVLEKVGSASVAMVDWNMPVMDGLSFVEAARSKKEHDDMIIVMVTSESEPRQMMRALHSGANEYIIKPYTEQIICEKLEAFGLGRAYAGADTSSDRR